MRKPWVIFSLVIAVALLCATHVVGYAQDDQSAKNIYLVHVNNPKKGRPGTRVRIELMRNGLRSFVPRSTVFRAGDKVKFHFQTNFDAYIKILNVGTTGKLQVLFPYAGATELVAKSKDHALPEGDGWFEFDHQPGKEQLAFIFSQTPLTGAATQASAAPPPAAATTTTTTVVAAQQTTVVAAQQTTTTTATMSEEDLAALNARALDIEGSKDLNLVRQEGTETYAFTPDNMVKKPLVLRINLVHGKK